MIKCDTFLRYNSLEVWNPQYRYRCSLTQGARWQLPVVDGAITTSVWLQQQRLLAVAYTNGKVVLAGMSRASGRGVVNHSDVKDQACVTMMYLLPF